MKVREFFDPVSRLRNNKYFLPGLKRWIFVLLLGIVSIIFGIALLLELRPLTHLSSFIWNSVRSIASFIPPQISGPISLIVGTFSVFFAIWFSIKTTLAATQDFSPCSLEGKSILSSLEKAYRKGQGPKIVAIGGGTGLSTLLRGLKSFSTNITAIVTVGDDGGSSGRLREELKVVPPGDIRNCIAALSDEEEVLTSVFQYRFKDGSLKGHSLGNLFLAALSDICTGDMSKATLLASRILRSSGHVLPSSSVGICLSARLKDGSIIQGESNLPKSEGQIDEVFIDGNVPEALPASVQAIKEAELIILGPGSLYTSIIPNLLFFDIVKAIVESEAKVLYVCNLVQDSETRGYELKDFLGAIRKHTNEKVLDAVLINNPDTWNLEIGKPITNSFEMSQGKIDGVEIIVKNKLHDPNGRHNPTRLARSIIQWFFTEEQVTNKKSLSSQQQQESSECLSSL